ncbi:MAG TPA: NADH-quinone oxidoreductase subunit N [Candidatus Acidoferrales bacterium]|nr:NADH-quinone oxidoreductase subunit N [Candidatus Acidoferrales bacterium]
MSVFHHFVGFLQSDGALIKPQLLLLFFGLGILLTDFLLEPGQKVFNAVMAMMGVFFAGWALWQLQGKVSEAGDQVGFASTLLIDRFAIFFGMLFLAATALVILLSAKYLEVERENHAEIYALMLFATIGMMFMVEGLDIVVQFIGLETMAFSFYILVGFLRRERRSNEAALKYLLLGAFSSGILAYGLSILYGLAGSTNLVEIANSVIHREAASPLVLLALVTVAAGLFFKVAAVPFHQWAPDVYEGAPTVITAYLSVASKAASFALLLRIFQTAFWPARDHWQALFGVVAVASMTVGNLAAITQTNIKRMLAYSSISHAGYILLGLVAAGSGPMGNETGLRGISFYLFAYAFMNLGAFAVVIILRRQGVIGDELEDLNGLIHRSPTAAVLLLIFMLSLAGIPPTAGFLGKYFIFLALLQTGHYYLAIFAALYVVPALYYYFRVIVHAFLRESSDPVKVVVTTGQTVALTVCAALVLGAGIYPEPFIRLANYSLFLPFGPLGH